MNAVLHGGFVDDSGLPAGLKAPAADSSTLMAMVVDELACGVMVLTLEGKTLDMNQAARAELFRTRLLEPGGDLPCDSVSENGKTLLQALGRAAEGKRTLVNLAVDGARPLGMAVVPLTGEPGTPTRAGLIFSRATIQDSLMLGFFARGHGLTATEEHVLGILCQGYSAPEIASRMKVAVSTIRSHVRSLCAKTRACGVRELVSRVAVLPPVAPATRPPQVH